MAEHIEILADLVGDDLVVRRKLRCMLAALDDFVDLDQRDMETFARACEQGRECARQQAGLSPHYGNLLGDIANVVRLLALIRSQTFAYKPRDSRGG